MGFNLAYKVSKLKQFSTCFGIEPDRALNDKFLPNRKPQIQIVMPAGLPFNQTHNLCRVESDYSLHTKFDHKTKAKERRRT